MEEQQAINFRRGRPRYTKLMPDMRESIRLGRRDFDAIHIWYLKARTGTRVCACVVCTSYAAVSNNTSGCSHFSSYFHWHCCGVAGPYVTDIRLVKTSWLMEPAQPYMEALRKAGFSVVFRPNKIVGGAFLRLTVMVAHHPV